MKFAAQEVSWHPKHVGVYWIKLRRFMVWTVYKVFKLMITPRLTNVCSCVNLKYRGNPSSLLHFTMSKEEYPVKTLADDKSLYETPIYVITLAQDSERRRAMKRQFPNTSRLFHYIDACDGQKLAVEYYYQHMAARQHVKKGIVSPAELGCALSHMAALMQFLSTDHDRALILEDDIIGGDQLLDEALGIANKLRSEYVFICGGQEGLSSRNYLLGDKTRTSGLYRVIGFSYPYLMRTCCYILTRQAATIILRAQQQHIRLADDWAGFFLGTNVPIYFANILKHPQDFSSSNIEPGRRLLLSKSNGAVSSLLLRANAGLRKLWRIILYSLIRLGGKTRIVVP